MPALCCSDSLGCVVTDAVVDVCGPKFTNNRDWTPARELVPLESMDDGNIAWIEFCDLLSHSLHR